MVAGGFSSLLPQFLLDVLLMITIDSLTEADDMKGASYVELNNLFE